ncbi:hypothetical protein NEF87_001736 [Candidatus Lokiarchaeum ossiferum]|uniref:DUF998 domain-containing protein n=1 Tax=Candidatus Lokiarchaeum ossiferum TaxID=2951803 RepID=A0ABY6HSB3_9ARCH|nr:hypothetical protein NEF87_001736 [Candidatus Lokiarchaeum sp. B-35]
MKLKDFLGGNFDHAFWKNRLCPVLIGQFLGTLLIAWALRPIWVDDSWRYIPFQNYISGLGGGRMEGNIGAWVFLFGFCAFPIIGTGWNSYLYRQFSKVSKIYAAILWVTFELSMICVAFVGIFDGVWPNPNISGFMHFIGATFSFMGHTISAVLVFIAISIIYWKTPSESRHMHHPLKFALVIVELVGVYLLFSAFGGPTWQWLIMLSLNVFLLAISRLFPEDLSFPTQKIIAEES